MNAKPHGYIKRWQVALFVGVCIFALNSTALIAEDPRDQGTELGSVVEDESNDTEVNVPERPDLQKYKTKIEPLLKWACFDCHSEEHSEGNFRADQLDPDFAGGNDITWWLEVYSVLSKGEMPPPESSELTDADRIFIVDWLSAEIQKAEKLRKSSGSRSSFRRLTRYEYNYALQDLLGVPWTFADDLPEEASEDDGFENNAESLLISAKQVETYYQLTLKALQRVTVRGERPPVVYWGISMEEAFQREKKWHDDTVESTRKKFEDDPKEQSSQLERLNRQFQASNDRSHYSDLATGMRAKFEWNYRQAKYAFEASDEVPSMPATRSSFAVVHPGSREALTVDLGDRLPDVGTMRVRIRASRAEGVTQRVPSLQLYFGFQATDQGRSIKRVSQRDVQILAPYGSPEIYEWDIPLSEIEYRNTYRGSMKLGQQPNPSEYIRFVNSTVGRSRDDSESPAILIDYVEVAAPVYDEWPPRTHQNLFIESDLAHDETAYAREIITTFMSRAWRQVTPAEIDRKVELFQHIRAGSLDFQEAIIDVLATILASPKFLYVSSGEYESRADQEVARLPQAELAARLSLFLWCSVPDETLLKLASTGQLTDPEVLRQQVNRMLDDPKGSRFAQHFVQQWLKMRPLEYLSPSRGENGLDEELLESMKEEPIALFADMIRNDSRILDFVDSDYLVVNERLASHYGIPGVQGNDFRRVALPDEFNRGGLLTQAGLLTMNSDGEDSHPVKRGVWLLTNLLNDPPPPPPPAVPEIDLSDPEIAKLSLKERIEDHRDHAACLSCHQKIDPWGIAFENYDALGRWREQVDGKSIDATSVLPNNISLNGIAGLKKHLAQDREEQFVRATVEKMASFALGRQLDFGDRAEVTDITRRVREAGGGIRTLVICLVTSDLFQSR
ncbi:DUF1592 domain-containing protein [Thalassoglobus neptunius]|uniref:DUF1592 domain-containing protein n=1 Tax=Thalassoglobus neptunius TaxID=1938619 RepID=UPI0018D228BC|nr:DUF1592 domain-containing protein [Thalassoglobus neptunius]